MGFSVSVTLSLESEPVAALDRVAEPPELPVMMVPIGMSKAESVTM